MDIGISLIAKIFGLGIVVVAAELVLKQTGKEEFAFWIRLGAIIICMFWVIPHVDRLFETVTSLFNF